MPWMRTSSRHVRRLTLSVFVLFGLFGLPGDYQHRTGLAYAAELKVPEEAPVERFDFEQQGIEGWKPIDGQWVVEEMSGRPEWQAGACPACRGERLQCNCGAVRSIHGRRHLHAV